MNQRFTYSIPPHALSFPATASHICVAEPRPTFLNHPVQPLKGLRTPRATSVSYRALAPYGANRPFGIEGCQTVLPQSILNSEFLILNWTYTFSAKERDSETGLSYFGSRYYSSDLSIWLSVDPMSDKYPSLSPYTYCADNPVKLVDPNGDTIRPTAAFQNSTYYVVFQNLSQTNKTYQQILSKYQDNTHDFILDYSMKYTSKAGATQMSYKKKGNLITYTIASSKYYRPNGNNQCEIGMVKTLHHEAVHAEDGLTKRETPFHDGFDQASVLAGLMEYNSMYNLGYSFEDLEILSWGGLQESMEYCGYIERRAEMNNRTIDEEEKYVKERREILMYGYDLDE